MHTMKLFSTAVALTALSWLPASEAATEQSSPATLEIFPPDINPPNARDRQLVVVQATYPDGITRDVTAEAAISIADPKLVKRDGNVLWPAADGKTEMTVAFGGQTVQVPVTVAHASDSP